MKKITIVRHAKSDWGIESLKDIDRHLNERGYSDAYSMSDWFRNMQPLPDAMVSSPAVRAISTAFIFARAFERAENSIIISPELYEATPGPIKKVIAGLNDKANSVMLFGHNPGLTNFANETCSEMYFENIPTCGIVTMELEISSWQQILTNGKGHMLNYKFPKSFREE